MQILESVNVMNSLNSNDSKSNENPSIHLDSVSATAYHQRLETECSILLEHFCRWRLTHAIDEIIGSKNISADNSYINSRQNIRLVVFPVTKMILSPFSQICMLCGSLLVGFLFWTYLRSFMGEYGIISGSIFRLIPQFQDCTTNHMVTASGALLGSIKAQFFLKDCELMAQSTRQGTNSTTIVLFEPEIRANNIRVKGIGSPFVVQVLIEGERWKPVGSTNYRATSRGIRILDLDRDRMPPFIDHRPPWPLVLETACHFLVAIAFSCIACCGFFGRVGLAKLLIGAIPCLMIFAEAVSAVGFLLVGLQREALYASSQLLSWIMCAAILKFTGLGPFLVLTIFGFVRVINRVLNDCVAYRDCAHLIEEPPVFCLAATLTGMAMSLLKSQFASDAAAGMMQWTAEFNSEWGRMSSEDKNREALARLDRLVAEVRRGIGSLKAARHFVHRADGNLNPAASLEAVSSLDLLYSQAMSMMPVLISSCKKWAAESGGLFIELRRRSEQDIDIKSKLRNAFAKSRSSQQLLEESRIAETFASWIDLGILKAPQRAAEKALTCYDGDVSRVVDISRQRIVFADLGGIADCLALIASARPSVRILRVKNSMRAGHDPRLTAGFRAVVLNLCFHTEETRALGIEQHVCEVQLTMPAWADAGCGTEELCARHRAYLEFRTARSLMGREYIEWYMPPESGSEPSESTHLADERAMPSLKPTPSRAKRKSLAEVLSADFFEYAGDCLNAQSLEEALRRAVFGVYRHSVQLPSGLLDRALSSGAHEAVRGCNASSACFSSQPLATGTCKLQVKIPMLPSSYLFFTSMLQYFISILQYFTSIMQVQIPMLLAALIYLGIAAQHARRAHLSAWTLTGRRVRFSVLGFRGGSPPPPGEPAFRAFGLHLDGCPVARFDGRDAVNHTLEARLEGAVRANGYFFETGAGPAEHDPVRWVVEAGDIDGGGAWEPIGASLMLWNLTAVQVSNSPV